MSGISSMQLAEILGKRHDNFVREVRRYITMLGDESSQYFIESSYTDKAGKNRSGYEVTLAGCDLIAGRMIGKKGEEFKDKYLPLFGMDMDIIEKSRYTVQEVAEMLGINERTVYRYIDKGMLKAETVEIMVPTYRKLITAEDLAEFEAHREAVK